MSDRGAPKERAARAEQALKAAFKAIESKPTPERLKAEAERLSRPAPRKDRRS